MTLLQDQVVFITGASRGIGRAIAERFAGQGAILILNGRTEEGLNNTAKAVTQISGSTPFLLPYDVADSQETQNAFKTVFNEFKRLDVLVNNAGIFQSSMLGMITEKELDLILNVNTRGLILHMQYGSRLMTRKQQGSIINLSSILARFGEAGCVAYSASKAAVIGATLSASKELASSNVRVNAIAPGLIDTDMTRALPREKLENSMHTLGLKRLGTAREVADAALFLASDMASYITGQVLGVDGGWRI